MCPSLCQGNRTTKPNAGRTACDKRAASAALASARKEALAAARLAAQETGFAADAERVAQAFTQRAAEIMAGLNK